VQLIVAEKPSVARDLARVLGVRPQGDHAFEGGGRVITWCIGHLVELEEPASYDGRWKAWRLDTLPMLPDPFRLRATKHAGAQRQAVARLLRDPRFAVVVNACDAGREGELIFRYVYQYARSRLPVQRLWISSLTDEAIRRGFAALAPGARYEPLADAARSRSEADWLVGMNATRAITVRGQGMLWSIGRVQTPTLAMVVARELAIRAFEPRPYWEVRCEFGGFHAWWRYGKQTRLAAAPLADAIAARDSGAPAVVEKLREKLVREPPPLLFDLTSLQRTANRRFGMTAERTLAVAQALYERHKLLTYPRTDARHLSSDLVPELPNLVRGLAAVPDYTSFAEQLLARGIHPTRRVVDDSKVHDHHAIIPTGKPPRSLDRDEQRIFDLVARRFLAAFFPDAEIVVTEAWICVGVASGTPPPFGDANEELVEALPDPPDRYLARGRVRRVAGWQDVVGLEDKSEHLPPLVEGQALPGASYTPVAKHTKPPPRFTEATLLGAMESAGKQIDDETLRLAMKDCGLGTPATRAAIIETLLDRRYIAREKQQLVPTPQGIALIESLPVASLASPELTGAWEARLARIARGEDTRAAFMADIARFVAELVAAVRGAPAPSMPPGPPVGGCPRCGGGVLERGRDYGCACGFTLPKRLAGRAIGPALAGVLLGKRKTQPLRGFRSKAGKKFTAVLVLDADGALRFDFAEKRAPETIELPCPRCTRGALLAGSRGWGCSRWRDGCKFVVWFETAGRRLTSAQLRDLVTKGKTRKSTFAPGSGRLVLDPALDDGAARFTPA
jgi:DNA topoisomerase III